MTVPILIALGVSVMKAQRQKQQALAAVEEAAVNKCEGGQDCSSMRDVLKQDDAGQQASPGNM